MIHRITTGTLFKDLTIPGQPTYKITEVVVYIDPDKNTLGTVIRYQRLFGNADVNSISGAAILLSYQMGNIEFLG